LVRIYESRPAVGCSNLFGGTRDIYVFSLRRMTVAYGLKENKPPAEAVLQLINSQPSSASRFNCFSKLAGPILSRSSCEAHGIKKCPVGEP
jgi:hypothetical protein